MNAHPTLGDGVTIDVGRLVESRLLVQGEQRRRQELGDPPVARADLSPRPAHRARRRGRVPHLVDEAHLFAPEAGQSESASAVIDPMGRGRKRGFCGVLATQRIAKLHKDAAAETNNKLIGRSALDIDMKRAAAELGMTGRDEMQALRKLPAGHFYAFGPVLCDEVQLVKVGSVETTHPKRANAPLRPRRRARRSGRSSASSPTCRRKQPRRRGPRRSCVDA